MAPELPSDFREFLKLLRSHGVKYLLIGGYAVIYHGYPRATGDMDIWIASIRTTPGGWWMHSGIPDSTRPISLPRSFSRTTAWSAWATFPCESRS